MKKGLVALGLFAVCLLGSQLKAQDEGAMYNENSNDSYALTDLSEDLEKDYYEAMHYISDEINEERKESMTQTRRRKGGDQVCSSIPHKDILNLTDEQKEQMKQIRMENLKTSKSLRDQLREFKAKQITLTTSESPNMNSIKSNIKEMGEIMIELSILKADSHQQIRSILDEEQRMKFDRMANKKGNKGAKGKKVGSKGKHAVRS